MTRVEELVSLITEHQNNYYKGQPTISDAEFDNLWDELKTLDPGNDLLQSVGDDTLGIAIKVKHIIPMGSQQKANSQEEVDKWLTQFKSNDSLLVEQKLDGCSIELYYRGGKFLTGISRGDGITGEDITVNAEEMQGCLSNISDKEFRGSIRGEVLLYHEDKERVAPAMANCRNAASGIMKRKSGEDCNSLHIKVYDVMYEDPEENVFETEVQKLNWLKEQGFDVVSYEQVSVNPTTGKELTLIMNKTNDSRSSLNYDIDGLVVKKNVIDFKDIMTNLIPKTQIAYKFPREELVSTLVNVEWSLNNGTLTPIGVIEPALNLCGTTVKQASLCNLRLIERGGFKLGCSVSVTKRGEIIPKIEKVYRHNSNEQDIVVPERCPLCGNKLYTNADHTKTQCLNYFCPSIKVGKMNKWVNVFGIKELAPTTLNKLLDSGIVDGTIASLYKIDYKKVAELEGFGTSSAENIRKNLNAVKEVGLADFIAGFNIPSIGSQIVQKIIDGTHKKTLDELVELKVEDCICPGVGEETARKFVNGLKINSSDISNTLAYVSIKRSSKGILDGLSVCFTGSLNSMKRNEAEKLVKDNGGTVKDGVVKGLTYLVTNDPDSGSSKNEKAKEYGTKIITEETFLNLFELKKNTPVTEENELF